MRYVLIVYLVGMPVSTPAYGVTLERCTELVHEYATSEDSYFKQKGIVAIGCRRVDE
jgi:hypothetical protein